MTFADARDLCIARWGTPRVDWPDADPQRGQALWGDAPTLGLYATPDRIGLFGVASGHVVPAWLFADAVSLAQAMDAADAWAAAVKP